MPRAGRLLHRAATALVFACVLLARPASGHDDGTPLSVTEGGSGSLDVTVAGTPYLDRATTSGVTYTYTVFARDAVGHESPPSNAVTLTAGGTGGGSGGGKGGRPR